MTQKRTSKDYGLIISIGLLFLGILSIFIPYFIFDGITFGKYSIHIGKYNELGDFIAGITSPFLSIAAFLLLYLTYSTQKKELKESQNLLSNQNELISRQQFENTFFNLLNLHNQIVSQIDVIHIRRTHNSQGITEEKNTLYGRDCFIRFYESFRDLYYSLYQSHQTLKEPIFATDEEFIDNVYVEFNKKRKSDLEQYFRNLYHIVNFVDMANISNKKDYINILRAQLSTEETLLLFFNCLSRFGNTKFKPLVEKYSLLKNIADYDELRMYKCKNLYNTIAFGEKLTAPNML
jgi:hypothetical protein